MRIWAVAALLTWLGTWPAAWSPCLAQQNDGYKRRELNERFLDDRNVRIVRSNKSKVLSGAVAFDEGKTYLDRYYIGYVYPVWTNTEMGGLYGDLRVELQRDLALARSAEGRAHVLKLVYGIARQIATSADYHPACRYNAMLILGDLNSKEPVISGTQMAPPVPVQAVLKFMLEQLASPEAPDVVKMGAMVGILRHVQLRMLSDSPARLTAAEQAGVAQIVLPVFQISEPPPDSTSEGHDWMRRRAADILGQLGLAGPNDAIAQALLEAAGQSEASLALRCAAAEALGRIDLSQAKLEPSSVAKQLGRLTADCIDAEVEALKKLVEGNVMGGEMMMRGSEGGMRGREMGYGEPETSTNRNEVVFVDERTVPSRRRLLARLEQIKNAVEGNAKLRVQGITKSLPKAAEPLAPVMASLTKVYEAGKDPESDLKKLGSLLLAEGKSLAGKFGEPDPAPASS